MGKFFGDLKAGLEEIIEYETDKKTTLRRHHISLSQQPAQYSTFQQKTCLAEFHKHIFSQMHIKIDLVG